MIAATFQSLLQGFFTDRLAAAQNLFHIFKEGPMV